MAPARLESLAQHLTPGFYVNGPITADSTRAAADRFHIIEPGRIRGEKIIRKDWRTFRRIPPRGGTRMSHSSDDGALEVGHRRSCRSLGDRGFK
ncbi:MAG TPA: hypothetical protein VEI74_02420 [Candidatus Methylomirabilis sp.]|nr:hypothetical protein [Candidatus Methylomirabilis sp.]